MRLGREACHVTDRADDPRRQDRTYAEDLGEGGARGFHLGLDALVQVCDLSVQRPDVAQHLRSQPPAEAPPWGRMPRKMRAARWAESFPVAPPGRRSLRSPCRRFSALVRSATRSISASRKAGAAPRMRPRHRPPPAARCAMRPRRWRGHRARRSYGRCQRS